MHNGFTSHVHSARNKQWERNAASAFSVKFVNSFLFRGLMPLRRPLLGKKTRRILFILFGVNPGG